jgi:signal transduction histidine kinase
VKPAVALTSTRLDPTARAFALLALLGPVLWMREVAALPSLALLALVWTVANLAQRRTSLPAWALGVVEAVLVGVVVGVSLQHTTAVIAGLALPPCLAGLRAGARGAAATLAVELIAVAGTTLVVLGSVDAELGAELFTWSVTGLGLGLVASFVHTAIPTDTDSLAAYRDARQLLQELLSISDGLSSGLDPVTLGSSILDTVLDGLPAGALTLFVPREDELTPLTRKVTDPTADAEVADQLASQVLVGRQPRIDGQTFAFPLVADGNLVGVVGGVLAPGLVPDRIGLDVILREQARLLEPIALRLDSALLFARFRDTASADERRRLGREMHDGVAQDIASMGYLVDSLAAQATTREQVEQLQLLRDQISSVVAEVRRSVLTLRSSVEGRESLGAAIGTVARHLSAVSGVPITVTIDEGTTRLRPEVEAELMRVTQEALNNAVRHAQASVIDVRCRVQPPGAEILIEDNGRGLQGKRVDSHGLAIMNERARLIGAELEIADRAEGGVRVAVRLAPELSTTGHLRGVPEKERVA